MADNVALPAASGNVAADEVTYSGDTSKVQLVKPVLVTGSEGAKTLVELTGDGTNGLDVDVTRVKPDGTNTMPSLDAAARRGYVQVTDGTNVATVATNGGMAIAGCTAHDTADAGSPVKIGARAIAHGTNPTAVAAADRTDLYANRAGVLFVIGGHPNVVTTRVTYAASAQTDVSLTGTQSAGTKVVVTQIQVTVSNATTATPSVLVGFGATNTPTGAGVVLSHPGIPGGGGVSRGDGSGILGVGADGEELRITAGAATGGTLDCVVTFYLIES